MSKMSSDVRVECSLCRREATVFYKYAVFDAFASTARCSDHVVTRTWSLIIKEDYLAHKAMEAL